MANHIIIGSGKHTWAVTSEPYSKPQSMGKCNGLIETDKITLCASIKMSALMPLAGGSPVSKPLVLPYQPKETLKKGSCIAMDHKHTAFFIEQLFYYLSEKNGESDCFVVGVWEGNRKHSGQNPISLSHFVYVISL